MDASKTGLILTGGGARGAFQAGALRAIYEIATDIGIPQPFRVISGTSAGAINAGFLGANVHNPLEAMTKL